LKKFLFPVLWGYCLFGAGCVYINSGTIFDSPDATGSHMVQATEKGDLGVLHLTAPEDLTVRANEKLLSQCPSGRLENVQDQLNERDFFWIVQSYTLRVKAICDPTKVAVVKSVLQKKPPATLNAKKTERGLVFTLGTILFNTNQATIRSHAEKSLDKLVSYLQEEPGREIMIEGYTDSTGRASWNRTLSEKRARNIEHALEKMGVNPNRIASVKGLVA